MQAIARPGVGERVVAVVCGTKRISDTYAGKTVAEVRAELADALGIPAGSTALLNGQQVPDETRRLTGADNLEFIQRTGTKG